jgi:DNA primase
VLQKAGLVIKKEEANRIYDRFRGRVIFPVHNLSGKVVAFGARILTKEKDQPKYINSPETEIYHKSNVLYGLFQAKNAIRRENFCYLVEGYTDVISLHLADVDNVVASSGTALTEEQIKLIKRFTENVTVLFDGDSAGIKAALRGIDLVLKGGLNVRVVLLPDGEDPDSFSRKNGSTEFKQYLKSHTKDFISFKIDLLATDALHDPIKKAEAIREIVTSVARIPDPIKRSVYLQETSNLLAISESVLISELNKILIQERRKREQETSNARREVETSPETFEDIAVTKTDASSMVQMQERETIRLLVNYADSPVEDKRLLDFLLHELDDVEFSNPVFKEIYDAFRSGANRGEVVDTYYFMEKGSDAMKKTVAEMITPRYETSKHWSDKYHIYFPHEKEVLHEVAYSNVLRLKFRLIQKLMDDNLQEMKRVQSDEVMDKHLTIHEQLKTAERELAEILGIVIPK